MKKSIVLFTMLFISILSKSQVTIDSSNFVIEDGIKIAKIDSVKINKLDDLTDSIYKCETVYYVTSYNIYEDWQLEDIVYMKIEKDLYAPVVKVNNHISLIDSSLQKISNLNIAASNALKHASFYKTTKINLNILSIACVGVFLVSDYKNALVPSVVIGSVTLLLNVILDVKANLEIEKASKCYKLSNYKLMEKLSTK